MATIASARRVPSRPAVEPAGQSWEQIINEVIRERGAQGLDHDMVTFVAVDDNGEIQVVNQPANPATTADSPRSEQTAGQFAHGPSVDTQSESETVNLNSPSGAILRRWQRAMKHLAIAQEDGSRPSINLDQLTAQVLEGVSSPQAPSPVPLADVVGYSPDPNQPVSEAFSSTPMIAPVVVPSPENPGAAGAHVVQPVVAPAELIRDLMRVRYKGFRGRCRKIKDRTRAWFHRNGPALASTLLFVAGAALIVAVAVVSPFGAVILIAGVGAAVIAGEAAYLGCSSLRK